MCIDGFVNGGHNMLDNWFGNDSMCMNGWCTLRYSEKWKHLLATINKRCARVWMKWREEVEKESKIDQRRFVQESSTM